MVLCTFCNKDYSSIRGLKAHQLRPSCLKNKKNKVTTSEVEISVVEECDYCYKEFTCNRYLKQHLPVCSKKDEYLLKQENKRLKQELEAKDKELEESKKELKRLTLALASRPVTYNTYNDNSTNNNIVNIKQYIKNTSEPMTVEFFDSQASKLTLDDTLRGGKGIAKFFCDNHCKDSAVITTDVSRKIAYHMGDVKGKILRDPKLKGIVKQFFSSIQPRSSTLLDDFLKQISDNAGTTARLAHHEKVARIKHGILESSKGNDNKLLRDFVRQVAISTNVNTSIPGYE